MHKKQKEQPQERTWDEILHDPRIDDSGNYDYLVTTLPQDEISWIHSQCKCEECEKYHRLSKRYYHYFYSVDGYDYMDYTICWKCTIIEKLHHLKHLLKKRFTQNKKEKEGNQQ